MADVRAILDKELGTAEFGGSKAVVNLIERAAGVDTIAELRALPIDVLMQQYGSTVVVRGNLAAYDWIPRHYEFDATSVAAHDGDAVVAPDPDLSQGRWLVKVLTQPSALGAASSVALTDKVTLDQGSMPLVSSTVQQIFNGGANLAATVTPALTDKLVATKSGTSIAPTIRQVHELYLQTEETGDFTLALTAGGGTTPVSHATQADVIIPLNSVVAFPINTRIRLLQTGDGFIRVLPTLGIELVMPQNRNSCSLGPGAEIFLDKIATDTWTISGDLDQPILQGVANQLFAVGMINMVKDYVGPIAKFRESTGNVDKTFYPGSDGVMDVSSALEHRAGASLLLDTVYNQVGTSDFDFVQAVDAEQPGWDPTDMNGLPCMTGTAAGNTSIETVDVSGLNSPQLSHAMFALFKRGVDTGGVERIIHAGTTKNVSMHINASDFCETFHSNSGSITTTALSTATVGTWYPFIYTMATGGTEQVDLYFDRDALVNNSGVVAGAGMSGSYALLHESDDLDEHFDGSLGIVIGILSNMATAAGESELALIRAWMHALVGRTA